MEMYGETMATVTDLFKTCKSYLCLRTGFLSRAGGHNQVYLSHDVIQQLLGRCRALGR